jgi:hypothetical protein
LQISTTARGSGERENLFDADGYRALSSDIVAHLVLTHQAGMTNLLTRAGWEARLGESWLHPPYTPTPGQEERTAAVMAGIAGELVDYLLFIDEAKLTEAVRGGSGFAERFSASGPRDRKGRSLYELDLNRRLMKYPCSYLIYSEAFESLPIALIEKIYARLFDILTGKDTSDTYESLTSETRQAILEILAETKSDLPDYWKKEVESKTTS